MSDQELVQVFQLAEFER